jgi:Glycosyl transferase family 2
LISWRLQATSSPGTDRFGKSDNSLATEATATGRQPRKVLFSAMKNEAPFVLEWIAYHKAIGFDEIVICSNPSNDGMEDVLAALADAGEIRHLHTTVPAGRSPQIVASRAYSERIGYRSGDWYLWLDADEFLNVHVGNRTISALIEALGDRQAALVNWRIFGSGGQTQFTGRFIHPAFARASVPDFAANLEIKTLFRFSDAVRGFGQQCLNRPLMAEGSGLSADAVAVGTGKGASNSSRKHRVWLSGADVRGTARVAPDEFGWALAQINHYIVRTPEFFALKRQRGRGYKADAVGAANQRHTDDFFAQNDRNEAEDRSILFWQSRVSEEIARILQIPSVAQAQQRSASLVTAILAQMDTVPGPETAGARLPAAPAPEAAGAAPVAATFDLTFPRKEARLVRRSYAQAATILEYGSGGSTLLGARLGKTIVSVESDGAWAARMTGELAAFPGASVHHVDIGPTGKWGMPTRPRYHGRFHRYSLSVWDRPDLGDPDLVLIDGCFRAACLVAVLLRARRPTTVLFDDYEGRPHYHGVEKLARKEEVVGRMARFVVTPGTIPPEMLTEVIGWFSDPR